MERGAVDYIVKPFSPTELVARVRAALRQRAAAEPAEPYMLGDLVIEYAAHSVTLAGRPVQLTAIEYRLLVELAAHAGRVVPYERLLRRVWGAEHADDLRPMRTVVSGIRRKLDDDADHPTYIFTEPRIGYRMARGEAAGVGSDQQRMDAQPQSLSGAGIRPTTSTRWWPTCSPT